MTRVPAGASEAAVACSLSQADLKRRQQRWLLLAERAHIDTVLTGNGLRLSFRADPMNERELKELTVLEQDCCAFANWFLHSRGDELVLDVSADGAEGIAAVQAMFRGWARHTARLVSRSRTEHHSPSPLRPSGAMRSAPLQDDAA